MIKTRQIALAPMLDWTDCHFRYLVRILTSNTLLYTEMITCGAILHGDTDHHLRFNEQEHPVALQLGGSDPASLAQCVKIATDYGYDEINLNVGCPSNRVQSGRFGACLMLEPSVVAKCVEAMREATHLPVTVKCRIGVDEQEGYEPLRDFIQCVQQAGCDTFIVHARKAWLKGLSPKQNREVPPLQYDLVYQLKNENPNLHISINGGIKNTADINLHLQHVDGVMIGRQAYRTPWLFTEIEQKIFANTISHSRRDIIIKYLPYVEKQLEQGLRLSTLVRPILCIFNGETGAKLWRRHLSTHTHKSNAGIEVITDALQYI